MPPNRTLSKTERRLFMIVIIALLLIPILIFVLIIPLTTR